MVVYFTVVVRGSRGRLFLVVSYISSENFNNHVPGIKFAESCRAGGK